MLVFGSMMHLVTFIFLVIELCMLCSQIVIYLLRPQDKHLKWYILLLFLLIIYTISVSIFPDPIIPISIFIQTNLAVGSGFLISSYFPYFFYKAFALHSLSWHVRVGVPLFLIMPYVIFFGIVFYFIEDYDIIYKYGIIIPFFYSFVVMFDILKAIKIKYSSILSRKNYIEEITVYCAVAPWTTMIILGYFKVSQPIEMIVTNTGFIVASIIFIAKSISRSRAEQVQPIILPAITSLSNNLESNLKRFNFTRREEEIVRLLLAGLKTKDVATKLYIAERTVTTHIHNIFEKAEVSNKLELFHILEKPL